MNAYVQTPLSASPACPPSLSQGEGQTSISGTLDCHIVPISPPRTGSPTNVPAQSTFWPNAGAANAYIASHAATTVNGAVPPSDVFTVEESEQQVGAALVGQHTVS